MAHENLSYSHIWRGVTTTTNERDYLTVHRDPVTNLITSITGWPEPGDTCPECHKGTMHHKYREFLSHDIVWCDACDYSYMTGRLKHLGPQKALDYFG